MVFAFDLAIVVFVFVLRNAVGFTRGSVHPRRPVLVRQFNSESKGEVYRRQPRSLP